MRQMLTFTSKLKVYFQEEAAEEEAEEEEEEEG